MDFNYQLDLNGVDEASAETGGRCPPGWYVAKLTECFPNLEHPKMDFHFQVVGGSYTGATVKDSLWDPNDSEDAKKAEMSKKKLVLWSKRMGLWSDSDKVSGGGSVNLNFAKAIGGMFVLHMERAKTSDYVNITFDGIFPVDHEKIPDEVRAALGITVPKRVTEKGAKAHAHASAPVGGTNRNAANGSSNGAHAPIRQAALPLDDM